MECKKATSEQRPYQQEKSPLQKLKIEIDDHKINRKRTLHKDTVLAQYVDPTIADCVKVEFQLKGHPVETKIVDGERRAVDRNNRQDVTDSDSSYYDKIYPLAMQYIDAIRENEEVAKGQ